MLRLFAAILLNAALKLAPSMLSWVQDNVSGAGDCVWVSTSSDNGCARCPGSCPGTPGAFIAFEAASQRTKACASLARHSLVCEEPARAAAAFGGGERASHQACECAVYSCRSIVLRRPPDHRQLPGRTAASPPVLCSSLVVSSLQRAAHRERQQRVDNLLAEAADLNAAMDTRAQASGHGPCSISHRHPLLHFRTSSHASTAPCVYV